MPALTISVKKMKVLPFPAAEPSWLKGIHVQGSRGHLLQMDSNRGSKALGPFSQQESTLRTSQRSAADPWLQVILEAGLFSCSPLLPSRRKKILDSWGQKGEQKMCVCVCACARVCPCTIYKYAHVYRHTLMYIHTCPQTDSSTWLLGPQLGEGGLSPGPLVHGSLQRVCYCCGGLFSQNR